MKYVESALYIIDYQILYRYDTCKDDIRILHRSSLATFDCFIREIAVTKVSIADPYSLQEASEKIKYCIEYGDNLNNRSKNPNEIITRFTLYCSSDC